MSKLELPSRKHIRLLNYDYSTPGWYFITICTKDKKHTLGHIENSQIVLSNLGKIVENAWNKIDDVEKCVKTMDFCIMPNHIHGVLALSDGARSLPIIVRRFKADVARCVSEKNSSPWQRNYYEHVIRDHNDYERIAEYIAENVYKWYEDDEYTPM